MTKYELLIIHYHLLVNVDNIPVKREVGCHAYEEKEKHVT